GAAPGPPADAPGAGPVADGGPLRPAAWPRLRGRARTRGTPAGRDPPGAVRLQRGDRGRPARVRGGGAGGVGGGALPSGGLAPTRRLYASVCHRHARRVLVLPAPGSEPDRLEVVRCTWQTSGL